MGELSWQAQREAWNTAGQCAREACRQPLDPGYRHPDTRLLYCAGCAALLQRYNPGLVLVADYPREPRADANADLIAHAPDDLAYRDPADDLELAADLGATLAGERRAA